MHPCLQVSTQLQLSMDQAKSLKKSLAQTDTALKKSQDGAMKLEEELKHMRAKAEGLQMRVRDRHMFRSDFGALKHGIHLA